MTCDIDIFEAYEVLYEAFDELHEAFDRLLIESLWRDSFCKFFKYTLISLVIGMTISFFILCNFYYKVVIPVKHICAAYSQTLGTCVTCWDREVRSCLVPCGHICCCDACLSCCKKCPLCNAPVRHSQKLYLCTRMKSDTES